MMAPLIRERAGLILDSLPVGEEFDWVDLVSKELTTMPFATLFNFPFEERRKLTFWSDWSGDTELGSIRALDDLRWSILQEMAAYFQSLWIERTHDKEPGDDLISMMIHSEAMNQMSPQEFMGNLILLITEVYGLVSGPAWWRVSFVKPFLDRGYVFVPMDRCA